MTERTREGVMGLLYGAFVVGALASGLHLLGVL